MSYQPWHDLHVGDKGSDVLRLQQLLAGGNRFGFNTHPGGVDGTFGPMTSEAVRRMKWRLGYPTKRITARAGETLRGYMVARGHPSYKMLPLGYRVRKRKRRGHPLPGDASNYPLAIHGTLIGFPYVGTHADFHNWESDNAIDISAHVGTRVLASIDGVIGPQIGPLDTGGDPQLLGLRLHIASATQELYYAHLSRLVVRAGQHVKVGQLLGYSGSANGVAHLHFATHHGDPAVLIGLPPIPGYEDRHYPG